ncbi:alpha-galactosidase A [Bacteroidaceae bacterium]|jgi:hypothetical protein|uniref:alpha-galactosidase D n=1 Tax=Prevotella sp. MGM2 TaxID=2033406 RepID=UPI000CE9C88A|nr:alpha-galactosidase [Prevotella sp. MGM2]GFI34424.1 alpha-galactosidase A [Bacteroidaceae bacterium]
MKKRHWLLATALLTMVGAKAYEPPTMGWSSWNTYRVNISDELIRRQADAMVEKGLKDVGYRYINIDDGFFGGRAADGTLLIHPTRFPDGLKPVADYIHSLGFKAGIYSDAGRNTCGNYWDNDKIAEGVGFYGHDQRDADFYFKEMGFDFIKIDFCGGDPGQNTEHLDLDERERYTAIRRAIDNTGRTDARVNVCRWAFPGTWVHSVGASWRISADIQANWNSVKNIIAKNRYLSAYATEGAFNDMDMLEIGRGMTAPEERTHFGMWCIQSSPLLIGCNMETIPETSLNLIKNKELIALNQDPLALQARVVRVENGIYLYVKDVETLNGKTRAVALYNSGDAAKAFTLNMAEVDLGGTVKVRDLFAGKDMAEVTGGTMRVTVPAHDTKIYRLEAAERLERTLYEAETAWLERYQDIGMNKQLGYATYEEMAGCSGGAKVGWLGNHPENWLEWRDVYSLEGGVYDMTLRYVQWEDRFVNVSVNGGEETRVELTASEPGTNKLTEKTVRVVLRKGNNVIRLSNPSEWVSDIDCMTLKKVETTGISKVEQGNAGNRALKLYSNGRMVVKSEWGAAVSIWDMSGMKRLSLQLQPGKNVIDSLPKGVYYILKES